MWDAPCRVCQFTRTTSRAPLFWEHTHSRTLSVLDDINNTPTDRIRYYLTYPRYGGGSEEEECWVSLSTSLSLYDLRNILDMERPETDPGAAKMLPPTHEEFPMRPLSIVWKIMFRRAQTSKGLWRVFRRWFSEFCEREGAGRRMEMKKEKKRINHLFLFWFLIIRKYQFMEANNKRRIGGLKDKIPDIQKTLETVRFLQKRDVSVCCCCLWCSSD